VAVLGEKIVGIYPHPSDFKAKGVIDAAGLYVLSGLIDAHNHPIYLDKMDNFILSAAFVGITTVTPFMQNMKNRGIEGRTSEAIQGIPICRYYDLN
jgi:dihydropyrimidinase